MTIGPLPMTRMLLMSEVPAGKSVGGDVDVQVVGAAVHQTGEGREEIVGVGGPGLGFGMVLHREGRHVEQGDAFGRAVVQVDVGELDAAEAVVLHHRRDPLLDPIAQVGMGRARAARKLGHERTERIEQEAEPVVLGGDFHAVGAQVHNRLVAAAVAELELFDLGAAGFGDHLVAQADAEDGHLAEQLLDLGVGAFDAVGVAGAVGKEDAVGMGVEHLFGRRVPRHHGHAAAHAGEVFQDAVLHAAVVGHDVVTFGRRRGEREGVRGGHGGRIVFVGSLAGHPFDVVHIGQARGGLDLRHEAFGVEVERGDHALLGAHFADVAHEGACVDAFDAHDVVAHQEGRQRLARAPVARRVAHVVHDHAGGGGAVALGVFQADAVVADLRVGHRDDLARVAGVGDDFDVADQGGVEAHLAERLPFRAAARTGPDGAVGEHEQSGDGRRFRRVRQHLVS